MPGGNESVVRGVRLASLRNFGAWIGRQMPGGASTAPEAHVLAASRDHRAAWQYARDAVPSSNAVGLAPSQVRALAIHDEARGRRWRPLRNNASLTPVYRPRGARMRCPSRPSISHSARVLPRRSTP